MITLDLSATLPSAPTVERAVLSCLCNHQELFDIVPHLTPDHFYSGGRDEMFSALRSEYLQHGRIDVISLTLQLTQQGRIDRMGGPSEFAELFGYCSHQKNFNRHLQTLNEHLARRKAILAALELGRVAFQETEIDAVLQAAAGPITAIFETIAESNPPKSTKSLVKASLQRYLDRCNGKASPMGYGTGIEEIDNALYGLLFPGRVIAIGAYPSGGKSVIGSQILKNTAKNGIPSLYMPLEMSENDLIDRAMIQAAGSPTIAWLSPQEYAEKNGKTGVTVAEQRAFSRAAETLLTCPFEIVKPANKKLQTILSTIRKAVRDWGTKVVAVDFIQQIRVPEAKGNKEQTMEEISHSLQEIAEELQVCLIVLSQLNADGDTKHGRVVEEDADAFLQVVQEMDKKKENFREHQHVLIVKDRHFGKGGERLPLILNKENIQFVHGFPKKSETTNRAKF